MRPARTRQEQRKTVDTVVFDLDGTLADTLPSIERALNRALIRHDLPPRSAQAVRRHVGEGGRALVEAAVSAASRGDPEALAEVVHRDYLREYADGRHRGTTLYPGVGELLESLAESEIRLALCTNKPTSLVETCLEELGLGDRFAAVVCGDSYPYRKPDPRTLLAAVRGAGGDPARALLIGDTEHDVRAARAANIAVACVNFGYGAMPARQLAPDFVIERFAEFPRLAGNSGLVLTAAIPG